MNKFEVGFDGASDKNVSPHPLLAEKIEQLLWLNVAKGIGIALVVLGHMNQFSEIKKYIFLFHMPLFFVISGFLFKQRSGLQIQVKIKSIFTSYIFFGLLVFVMDNFLSIFTGVGAALPWGRPIYSIAHFAFGGDGLFGTFAVFWFVTSLAISLIFMDFLSKKFGLNNPFLFVFLSALALISLSFPKIFLPLGIGTIPLAMFFMYMGFWGRQYSDKGLGLMLLGLIFVLCSYQFLENFDMKAMKFGSVANIFFALGFSALVMGFSKIISKLKWLAIALGYLGSASMTIMYLHFLVIVHGGFFITEKYYLLFVSIFIPVFVHFLFGKFEFTRFAFLGEKRA